jgi:integrase/recombinase XerD
MSYKAYLEKVGITPGMYTSRMNNLVNDYLNWLTENQITIEDTSYKELMNFIGHMQSQGKSKHHINRTLQSISHYYQYKRLPNIAQTTRIKGVPRTQPQNLLTVEELDSIYEAYEPKPDKGFYYHSDKLILGLIIYQAVDMREFMKIELKHLQLEKGQIYLGESRQKKSRVIPLRANQILSLNNFNLQVRSTLLKGESEKLFAPQADDYSLLHWQFKQLSKKVKQQIQEKLNLQINKLSQLRQSRIAIWTKEEGLRQAQYLAGFRRVGSAERYRQANLQDLKEQIALHHPLK